MPQGFVEHVGVQFERLRRHCAAVQATGDEISLLDLAATLRIWAEMKGELFEYLPGFSTYRGFIAASPASKLAKRVRNVRHLLYYLGRPVTTCAPGGKIFHHPEPWAPHVFSVPITPQSLDPPVFEVGHFCMVEADLTQEESSWLHKPRLSSVDYRDWLGSEVVRVAFAGPTGLQRFALTRENFIKRVPNVLGGSHPQKSQAAEPDERENQFDPPIRYLLQTLTNGIPLPYFVLVNCAHEILRIGDLKLPHIQGIEM
ncbi:MAG TPA: hypothetical protein VHO25_11135 [Polyangiaceae bacterium]|nr:hypothetical protein [Polyangiaceae bacterium]